MNLQDLNSYKVAWIRTQSGLTEFGEQKTVYDEGDLFRIADLHVIWKGNVLECEIEDGVIKLTMKNGEWMKVGVVK